MNLIVAVDRNWAIGYHNGLLARIAPDLKRFKALTMGHPVLLGRRTLETFPGGRPLPGRRNLILSRQADYAVEGAQVLHSVEEARAVCPHDTFVIGGESVYRALLDDCDAAYVTRIEAKFPADAWFPNLEALPEWTVREEGGTLEDGGLTFRYVTYGRGRQGHVR